jgi:hypothetical protein
MATRIDKKVSQNLDIANNYSALQSFLLRRAGRKLNDINYVGLLRNNALSDLEDPGEALTNILEYITRIDDANEISIYGTYKPEDFEITREFVENEITSSFLTPLAGISIAGGVAGATVSTNPRIRVEDRIDQINAFTGKGTLNGLHAGPTAVFYRAKAGIDQEFGRLKFTSFNENTGVISLTPESTGIEGGSGGDSPTGKTFVFKNATTKLNFQSQTSFNPDDIVLTLKGYINPATNQEISLVGTGITIKGTVTSSYVDNGQTIYVRQFQTTDANSLAKLKELKGIIGANFISTYYKFSRQFSILNPPQWFLESPGTSSNNLSYSADDINPETTQSLLEFRQGAFKLYSEKEYFNSGAYVETRIPVVDRYVYNGNNITKDSNMRFSRPPRVLRDNQNNWGVRWDGFLRIDNDGVDRKYIFEIETNTAIRIDIVNGGTNLAPTWSEVFNSYNDTKNAKFIQEGDRYISKISFNLDNLPSRFIYKTNSTGTTGYRYVPISIRMWNGGLDAAYQELEVPQEPNVFIKYAESSVNPNTQDTFYSGELTIGVSEQGPNKIITPVVGSELDLKAIILDSSASVVYQVVAYDESITRITGEDINGNPIQETVTITVPLSTPETITLTVVSNVIYSNVLPSRGSGNYVLRLVPNRNNYSQTTLWSSTIVSPKDDYNGYGDLLSVNFEPSIYKYEFDSRPPWWKVSEGNRYLFDTPISKTNDPLDGFVDNLFKSSLQSNATGVGKYGNGSGIYTSRPNLILGEGAYSGDTQSSNYIGMRLVPNLLGEGGLVKFTGIPVNNALFDSVEALGVNDLGGTPNHQTIAAANVTAKIAQMYWEGVTTNRFYVNSNLATVTVSDNPVTYGFPAFASESDWAKPIIVNAVANADNLAFTTNVQGFVAPLVMSVERVKYNTSTDTFVNNQLPLDTNEVWLLAFGTPFVPAQTALNGKFVKYFLEGDIAFQFAKVDTGESISFSDTLKVTYSGGSFVSGLSEVPKVPSERVTPFGYDQPSNYTSGICYPPYIISDILLKDIAISDSSLYNPATPVGNYDVFWGDHTLADLGGKKLNISEKIEFSYSITDNPVNIVTPSSKSLNDSDYTHRIKVELPIFKQDGTSYNEDVYEHIGNQEKVKDTYYLFVNAKQNPLVSNSPLLSGIG